MLSKDMKESSNYTMHIIGLGNVSRMSQGKLRIKQVMECISTTIPGVSELKWTGIRYFQTTTKVLLWK